MKASKSHLNMGIRYKTLLIVLLFNGGGLVRSQPSKGGEERAFFLKEVDGEQPQLLVVTFKNGFGGDVSNCKVVRDETFINDFLSGAPESNIKKVDSSEFQSLLEECGDVTTPNPMAAPQNGDTTTPGYDGWNVIFPGTKWCGAGDIAKNYDDVGTHADTDKCCRTHDHCDDLMAPGETRNNLTNSSPFTKLSCQCDDDFYNCLDRVDSMISNKIGNLYFNLLRRDCYKSDYPLTRKCKTFRSFLKITCKEYAKNTKASKIYQWVKPKTYLKLPVPGPLTITLPFSL